MKYEEIENLFERSEWLDRQLEDQRPGANQAVLQLGLAVAGFALAVVSMFASVFSDLWSTIFPYLGGLAVLLITGLAYGIRRVDRVLSTSRLIRKAQLRLRMSRTLAKQALRDHR